MYRHKRDLAKQANERGESKPDSVETMLASSTGLMKGVMSMGLTGDKTNCVTVPPDLDVQQSLLGKIIQFGRSQAAAAADEAQQGNHVSNFKNAARENSDVSHRNAAIELEELRRGRYHVSQDVQSPDVFLVAMDTEESDVDLTTPLCDKEINVEFPAVASSNASGQSSVHSPDTTYSASNEENDERDLIGLDSDDDVPRQTQTDQCIPNPDMLESDQLHPNSSSSCPRRVLTFPLKADREGKWLKSVSLDRAQDPIDNNKLRRVKSEHFQDNAMQQREPYYVKKEKSHCTSRFISCIL